MNLPCDRNAECNFVFCEECLMHIADDITLCCGVEHVKNAGEEAECGRCDVRKWVCPILQASQLFDITGLLSKFRNIYGCFVTV